MWKKIKSLFKLTNHTKLSDRLADDKLKMANMNMRQNNTDNHLIALARLTFIKPEVLYRESQNIKANGEYLLKLLEEQQKNVNKTEASHDN